MLIAKFISFVILYNGVSYPNMKKVFVWPVIVNGLMVFVENMKISGAYNIKLQDVGVEP